MRAIYNRPSGNNAMFYQPEIWLTNLQLSLGNYFKGVIKVKSLGDAKTVGADLIAVVDVVGELTVMTSNLTLSLGAVFSTPDGKQVASVSAQNLKKGNLFATNPAANAQDAQLQFNKALLYAGPLVSFAQSYRRPAPAAVVAVKPAGPQESTIDEPTFKAEPRPQDFALVIGIEEYQSLPKADYGVRDAQAVRKNLEALGLPARNIVSLLGSSATRSKLQSYLEEWLPLNVKPGSTLFFYYSGHGAPDPKTGDAYLVPWDGDPKFLKSSAYPLKQLYASLEKLQAKSVIVALDSCFSGAGGRSVLAQGARPLVTKTADLVPAGTLSVLTAASGEEITGSSDEQRHGTFTYFFLKGLAEGKRSTGALYEYLKPLVQDEAHRQNREQTPGLFGAETAF